MRFSTQGLDLSTQLHITAKDADGLLGYLVVDTTSGGRSHGGVRMHPEVTAEEIALLAQTMTSKYGFLGLPFGGAKAGVVGDPEAPLEQRRSRLARFGRAIAPLLQRELFVPAADMGTDLEDIRHMLRAAGVRFHRRRLPPVSSGTYTAHSVFAALREMARFRSLGVADLSVALEGFGKVGSVLAGLLAEAGAKVVAISTSEGGAYAPDGLDIPALLDRYPQLGSGVVTRIDQRNRIESSQVPMLPVDAFCPCANIHSVHEGNASDIQARMLCPGANNPWTPEAERILQENGAVLLPDFAANTGGILGTFMAYTCFSEAEIVSSIEHQYAHSTRWLLEQAQHQGVPIRTVADRLVSNRRVAQAPSSQMAAQRWAYAAGISMHRRGLVPGALVRLFTRRFLRRRLRLELGD